jgi:hypothetical protein
MSKFKSVPKEYCVIHLNNYPLFTIQKFQRRRVCTIHYPTSRQRKLKIDSIIRSIYPLTLILILNSVVCYPQIKEDSVFRIEKIPTEGILLDKGWKFHVGDEMPWANSEFEDNDWQPINPTLEIQDLPQIPKSGFCWFRLHLSIDSNLSKNQLALLIQQSGASEIYLNGRLIQKFGILNSDLKQIEAYDPLDKPV